MKKILVIAVILLVLAFVVACDENKVDGKGTAGKNNLTVTCSSWNGWDANYESNEEEFEYKICEGKIIVPDNDGIVGGFEFQIEKLTDEKVRIKTNQCMSCRKEGENTINLNSKEDVFEIKRGEKIELVTLTTDCGDIYLIEY